MEENAVKTSEKHERGRGGKKNKKNLEWKRVQKERKQEE